MHLANKKVLLTGASGGVGAELAKQLAAKGAVLALVGRNEQKLEKIKDHLTQSGSLAIIVKADINETGSAEKIIQQVEKALGGLDIIICNAGVLDFVTLENQSESSIDNIIQTNVNALIKLSRAALKRFKPNKQGHFVMIGSVLGSLAFPHFATYCASKYAVHGFSQALRRELVDTNIGVTYIAPRGIKTAMTDGNTGAMFEATGSKLDTPEKVANVTVRAIEKEKQEVFIGQPQSFFAWLNGFAPRLINLGLKKQTALAEPYLEKKR